MKEALQILIVILLTTTFIVAQVVSENKKNNKSPIKNSINGIESSQAVEGDVIFTDGTNQLLRITDEGSTGAIQFPSGIPSNVTNKLYNNDGVLYFDSMPLNTNTSSIIDSLDQLSDAKTDVTSIFVGKDAGLNDDGGLSDGNTNNNAAFGRNALKSNTTGSSNNALGNSSMFNNTTGIYNVAVGNSSLGFNTSGFNNVALGVRSLYLNSNGYFNVGLGYQVGYYNQEGIKNTFLGTEAGKGQGPHNKSGGVFIGYQAGFNEEGDNKLYINNDSSSDPLIWGDFTDGVEQVMINGNFHVTGDITTDGIVLGPTELNDLTDSKFDGESLFIGDGAGASDDAGASDGNKNLNLGIGKSTLNANTIGDKNSAVGHEALFNNIAGSRNTAIGAASMYNNTSGNANVALGFQTNYFNETGLRNTLIGNKAGYGSAGISFSDNIFIGYQAGYFETASNKLYIENTNSETPLIWGDFEADQVRVNGSFEATTKILTPKIKLTTGASEGHVLTSDADGNAIWQSPENVGFAGYIEFDKNEAFYGDYGDNLLNYFIEEYDLGNVFDPTAGEFTAPLDGFYNFVLNVTWRERSADFIARVKLKRNGQVFPGSSYQKNVNTIHSAYTTVSFSLNIYLQENDVITAWFDAYNPIIPGGGGVIPGSVYTVVGGNGEYTTTFSGFKIH